MLWDCVNGLSGVLNEDGKYSNNPLGILNWLKDQTNDLSTILLVKDFHKFYEDPTICRTIKELFYSLKKTTNNLIFNSHIMPSSEELDELLTIITLPLPDQTELANLLSKISKSTESNLNPEELNELAAASSGLSETRVKQVAAKALTQRGKISKDDLKDILAEKRRLSF